MIRATPQVQTDNLSLSLIQGYLSNSLLELQKLPLNDSTILPNIALSVGLNSIDHSLNRKLIGWVIVRQRSLANIFDNQDTNLLPNKTLYLTSDAIATVDIIVF